MSWLYVAMAVASFSMLNFASKMGPRRGGSSAGLVAVLMVVAAVFTLVGSCVESSIWSIHVVILGAAAALGGCTAWLLYVKAMQIGHYGFSNAMWSTSFLPGLIFVTAYWHEPLSFGRMAGIAVLLLAVCLIAASSSPGGGAKVQWGKWAWMIGVGCLLNSVPLVCQKAVSQMPGAVWPFMGVFYVVGALMMLPLVARSGRPARSTLVFGCLAGAASAIGNLGTIWAMVGLGANVVSPVTLSGTMVGGVALSWVVFREPIRALGYVGMVMEIAGIAMIFLMA